MGWGREQCSQSSHETDCACRVVLEPWRGSGLVLLVDDEELVRDVVTRMLKLLGFSVLAAEDGEQAVALFAARHHEIRVVLLDLKMPRMDGPETIAALRKHQQNTTVILSSGYLEDEAQRALGDQNVAGFIQKPYAVDVLRDVLRVALEG